MASPVLLILGAGANVGASVARSFASKGYKVAVTSRSGQKDTETADYLNIQSDLSDPYSVKGVFSKVKEAFGVGPSVVVYNAGAAHFLNAADPITIPLADFITDLNINTTSVVAAAQEAVLAFGELPATASRTFIFTGNLLNTMPMGPLFTLGVGKAASAHLIAAAAEGYKNRGFKFYYADQRTSTGGPVGNAVNGPAHGKMYLKLSEDAEQGPWQQTFVADTGYVNFAA